MPKTTRNIIELIKIEERVRKMVLEQGLRAPAVVTELMQDQLVLDRLRAVGYKAIYPSDIYNFLVGQTNKAQDLLSDGVRENPDTAALVLQTAKAQVLSILDTSREWESTAKRCLSILDGKLDEFEMAEQAGDKEARFPYALVETTRKAISTSLEVLRTIRGDANLQGLIRANTVHMQTGISQDELHQILFALGDHLGIDRPRILEAYTAVLMRKRQNGRILDVEAKMEGRGAAMTQAIEKAILFPTNGSSAV